MSFYDDIMQSLNEAIDYINGKDTATSKMVENLTSKDNTKY